MADREGNGWRQVEVPAPDNHGWANLDWYPGDVVTFWYGAIEKRMLVTDRRDGSHSGTVEYTMREYWDEHDRERAFRKRPQEAGEGGGTSGQGRGGPKSGSGAGVTGDASSVPAARTPLAGLASEVIAQMTGMQLQPWQADLLARLNNVGQPQNLGDVLREGFAADMAVPLDYEAITGTSCCCAVLAKNHGWRYVADNCCQPCADGRHTSCVGPIA